MRILLYVFGVMLLAMVVWVATASPLHRPGWTWSGGDWARIEQAEAVISKRAVLGDPAASWFERTIVNAESRATLRQDRRRFDMVGIVDGRSLVRLTYDVEILSLANVEFVLKNPTLTMRTIEDIKKSGVEGYEITVLFDGVELVGEELHAFVSMEERVGALIDGDYEPLELAGEYWEWRTGHRTP